MELAGRGYGMKPIHDIRRENLLRLINERYDGSQTKLADALGVRPNYISRLCTAGKNIGDELARKLEHIAELAANWLDQDHATRAMAANIEAARRRVPIVTWQSVGKSRLKNSVRGDDNALPGGGAQSMLCPVECSDRTVALEVKGASMLPRFSEGDFIFADPDKDPLDHSGFCLAMLPGESEPVFRQLFEDGGRKYLRALNDAFPDQMIRVTRGIEIIGAVICKVQLV